MLWNEWEEKWPPYMLNANISIPVLSGQFDAAALHTQGSMTDCISVPAYPSRTVAVSLRVFGYLLVGSFEARLEIAGCTSNQEGRRGCHTRLEEIRWRLCMVASALFNLAHSSRISAEIWMGLVQMYTDANAETAGCEFSD